ncbi:MAG: hypothetical protein QXY62_01510 [Candidatus Altiarchaeota archaeon]
MDFAKLRRKSFRDERAVEDLAKENEIENFDLVKHGQFKMLELICFLYLFSKRSRRYRLICFNRIFGVLFYVISRFLMYRYKK